MLTTDTMSNRSLDLNASCVTQTVYLLNSDSHSPSLQALLSASVSFTILDTSYKQNRAVMVLLRLAYFTSHNDPAICFWVFILNNWNQNLEERAAFSCSLQPRCRNNRCIHHPTADGSIKKMWSLHTMEYFSTLRRKEIPHYDKQNKPLFSFEEQRTLSQKPPEDFPAGITG